MTYIDKLDYFLNYISDKEGYVYSHDIYNELKGIYSTTELTLTVEKLHLDKYIDVKIDNSPNVNKVETPYYCRINYHGLRFIENGGYKSEIKRIKKTKFISNAKIGMIIIHSIIIIIIAIAGVYVSYDSNKKEEIINKNNIVIDSLTKRIDKLENNNVNKLPLTHGIVNKRVKW